MSVNTSDKYRQKTQKPITPNGNPEYDYWFPEWCKIRDCVIGQKQVRAMSTFYLPKYAKMTDTEYAAYLNRAPFYNMTARTLDGMVGTAFLRDPKITGLDEKLVKGLGTISKKGSNFLTISKQVCEEVIKVGRTGVLCDMTPSGGAPYLSAYLTENIVDWETEVVDDRETLTKVVLREVTRDKKAIKTNNGYSVNYRVLVLKAGVYSQEIFEVDEPYATVDFDNDIPNRTIVPTLRGTPFDRIPFVLFGPRSNEPEVEKPPLLDIVDLNLSHYQSSAQLEQGRWYTGLPIYYAEVGTLGEQNDYVIAPNMVWQVTPGAKAGIIEFNGQGLKFLENALEEKENQISALGGRMITNRPDSTGKSTEETKMNDRNERSLLVNVTYTLDSGFTHLLRFWAKWQDQSDVENIFAKFNKDFMLDELGAREFRAIHQMYMDNILPIEALHEVFQRINIIPDTMDLEEFKAALDDVDQFPNNPDFLAKKAGFPDAKARHQSEEAALLAERNNSNNKNSGSEDDE